MMKRLNERIKELKAPVVVGLDPQLSFIPGKLLERKISEYGESLEAVAEAFYSFNTAIIDAVCDIVPAVKPQVAMYEQYGLPGMETYKKTIDYAHKKGLIVIGDIKRGDIGSTSSAYAVGHLGTVKVGSKEIAPFDEDIVTVNPYLGTDGVQPFVDVCRSHKKGIFVLVKTSNPSSGELQDKEVEGKPIYEHMGMMVEKWGESVRNGDFSSVGAVVGATYPEMGRRLREIMPHTMILVPGYGAQGGTGKDLAPFFRENGTGAIVNSSRGIIAAYKNEKYSAYGEEAFADASRAATEDMIKDITSSNPGLYR